MDIVKAIQSPPPEFSACAFWFWNGELKSSHMLWQMDEMQKKGVCNAFMHARAYLKTPYMGEAWFRVMDDCVHHAKEIGFYPWLYDEYAWPSGTCGSTFSHGLQAPSRVLAKGRQNMAKGLFAEIITGEPDANRRLVAACPLEGGRTMAFYECVYETAVDYLNPGAIRDFLACTHEVYKARYGDEFGKTIPGIFFDEIYLAARPLPWTDALPEAFEKAYGYDLLECLPALMEGDGEQARKVRGDYYDLLADLYEKAFFRQIADWCAENKLRLTGHTEEDLAHHPRRQGDYFRTIRRLHIPGADCHDYRYRYPRGIAMHEPKYAVSVARLYDKPRAMSEAMGGAGWGCTLQEYKRGVNALGAAGIDMFVLHGFYNDCEHQGSQGDWPASFFYQNPYWKYFKHFAEYIHRVSTMNSLGEAAADAGLYYPIGGMTAHTVAGEPDEVARETDRQFHAILRTFMENQIDMDYIDADSLLSARVENGRLCAGRQKFRLLILPSNIRMTDALSEKLNMLRDQGGLVLFFPAGEGEPSGESARSVTELLRRYQKHFAPDIEIVEGARDKLYANHRVIDGQDMYMLASILPEPRRLRLSLQGRGAVQKLNPESGEATPLPYARENGRLLVNLALEADEACWLLTGCEQEALPPTETGAETVPLDGDWSFLPLDQSYDSKWEIGAKETILSIPLARFTDVQTGFRSNIRIRNTAEENGRCGRHVSLWKSNWLGRRVGWGDDADKRDLYFVKPLTMKGKVLSARVCIAAVNRFTLYINGREAARHDSKRQPCTLDIAEHLRIGRNLIAVHVHTNTPLDSRELTQAETLPPEALASLLLQGEIHTEEETIELLSDSSWAVAAAVQPNWTNIAPETVKTVDPKTVLCHVMPGLNDTDWVWAWERGRPPIQPWGDLPLFGKLPLYPRAVRYTVTLLAGAMRIDKPDIAGDFTARLDGKPVSFTDGFATLPPDGRIHELELDVAAPSPDGGLLDTIRVHLAPQTVPLGDWRERGLSWFSGRALYQKSATIPKKPGRRYMLDLGKVCFYAEVWVNGALCGTRIWEPYRMDITEQLKDGENVIAVVVANSAACERLHMLVDEGMALSWNRYWNEDNIDREPEALISGLLGPVVLLGNNTM
ncbi:MAG: hypothetical protein JW811_07540 [Clostridiales bacterium]|nr:hypothetical protein [Clostridiales bacterium]